ncbi:tRNA (cytidine(56)-2'-O)-methyltransferase [Candidatus Bathyarchaeota archaeon]|nr:tRNA (cytidine(56)-2'-O)-methyltransferase [Candidatus Bathyarchaeota archaeon]NIU81016.1 tRNA (cytidine(56)-2'-O)-methyltransferase [Candidatus Bathyarchaeota archaeon]NIV67672.1 tRNA (cytidine(56)-2'-O)-methyltransferase [Candidatus Bathyarchaeota archaeon]NIW16242.1 tRNA (cytidine(56)-2'-O)-methyltransferase [Candidatus Bathyarchaeota archaeon]NIW34280.1 tRNA (cytidine(56)-2'-O)-methyltransferase [Candidatus Bathyarchaeota archaeon]
MIVQKVWVLRLGHRIERDKRATMHVFLTARALSASGVLYSGQKDTALEKRVRDVVERWGGSFEVRYRENWGRVIKDWRQDGTVCHLTMYGINIEQGLGKIQKDKPLLVIVGSQKVHKEAFKLADYNIAIGNQPHSEIAALAIFLDRLHQKRGLKKQFEGGKMKIIPQESGKRVVSK